MSDWAEHVYGALSESKKNARHAMWWLCAPVYLGCFLFCFVFHGRKYERPTTPYRRAKEYQACDVVVVFLSHRIFPLLAGWQKKKKKDRRCLFGEKNKGQASDVVPLLIVVLHTDYSDCFFFRRLKVLSTAMTSIAAVNQVLVQVNSISRPFVFAVRNLQPDLDYLTYL